MKTSAGKLSCKKLYHGFVTTFNNRDSEFNVRSIVSKCLENAETDQYRYDFSKNSHCSINNDIGNIFIYALPGQLLSRPLLQETSIIHPILLPSG